MTSLWRRRFACFCEARYLTSVCMVRLLLVRSMLFYPFFGPYVVFLFACWWPSCTPPKNWANGSTFRWFVVVPVRRLFNFCEPLSIFRCFSAVETVLRPAGEETPSRGTSRLHSFSNLLRFNQVVDLRHEFELLSNTGRGIYFEMPLLHRDGWNLKRER